MSQLAHVAPHTPSAMESIAAAKALFTKDHKRKQLKIVFNSFDKQGRGLICIAGGLSSHDCFRNFEDFNDIELQKIRRGMQVLQGITKRIYTKVGDVNKLKPSHFTL
ncbi:hypothetical protein PVK64_02060 [Aliivibrio sp. S4TY2]|uniref:hypothetical protein n=1 Tax=unclassified Aliivibrio TaxID=2645654 RepID=UPI002379124B|nr:MULTISPECIES: hypothetical protein [unclassified Aliivibrio]MDD9154977.1 hypothetical protein [Aliivibrio sp. S4TY2]MDD9158660.1 hypothetical protein [Aliivibrio sp. S4TY1]MDD9162980.1 hypothetical protein [Aliivibrio sp. S4MY2]MDD9166659.1 hypothetical protein [Aliivibrio sp. S4MY4]MDD9184057.1 hypothetical protein [Aliivibrio sp. S4MY3]